MCNAEGCESNNTYINSQVEEDEHGSYMVYYAQCSDCNKYEVIDIVDLKEDMETQDEI